MGETQRPKRLFGIKDLFTSANALSGTAAICLCLEGQTFYASLAILFGWLADAFDGMVARALGTANRFGGEYDTIADHLAHIIAPATIAYTVYRHVDLGLPAGGSTWVAAVMAGAIMVTGSVRHARNIVRPVTGGPKGVWCGLPRTVVGFLALCYSNAQTMPYVPGGWWFGVAVCLLSCWGTLTYFPFASHHRATRMRTFGRIMISLTFITTFGSLALPLTRPFVFDIFMFWMLGYCLSSWMAFTKDERDQWRAAVAASKARGELPA